MLSPLISLKIRRRNKKEKEYFVRVLSIDLEGLIFFLILNQIRFILMLLKIYYEKLLENLKCHDIESSI